MPSSAPSADSDPEVPLDQLLVAAVKADLELLDGLRVAHDLPDTVTNRRALAERMVDGGYAKTVDGVQKRLSGNGLPRSGQARRAFLSALQRTLENEFTAAGDHLRRDYMQFMAVSEHGLRTSREAAAPAPPQMDLESLSRDLHDRAVRRDHFTHRLPRLKVPCSVYTTPNRRRSSPEAIQVANRFLDSPENNLFVVLGEFGSGKSELLRRTSEGALRRGLVPLFVPYTDLAPWLRDSDRDAMQAVRLLLDSLNKGSGSQFLTLMRSEPNRVVLLIDAFDEANLSVDVSDPGPNLSRLSQLLVSGAKVAVATRRSLSASPEAFLGQLASAARRSAWGVRSFQVIELHACELQQVDGALAHLPSEQAQIMHDYLTTSPYLQMDRVRRPLFLQMMLDLPTTTFPSTEAFSVYRLFDIYTDTILDRELDRTESRIPTAVKRRVLNHVAREMFASQIRRTEARLSREDLQHLVSDMVRRPEYSTWVDGPQAAGHSWYLDFIRSSPLIVAAGPREDLSSAFEFVHHSLFEFFLTQYFVAEFEGKGRFGLQDDRHSVRAFDSLLPYFLRAQFVGNEDKLEQLVLAPTTSNLDRLLAFFLLEDSPKVLDLLRHSQRNNYDAFLHQAENDFDSHFMKKVVRFQLVLLDDGIGKALAYVYDARRQEVDQDLDIEVHTFAAGQRPTEFLLNRIENPQLQTALPIWVYRLGLFGEPSALNRLHALRDHPEPMFSALVDEAIRGIHSRHGGPPGPDERREHER